MSEPESAAVHHDEERKRGVLAWWNRIPLYQRILGALVLGTLVGAIWGPEAGALREVASLILRLLRTLATPLIMVAVIHAVSSPLIGGQMGRRLPYLLATNTLMAIFIGLLVANVIQPGRWAQLGTPGEQVTAKPFDPWSEFASKIPTSVMRPLVENDIIPAIIIALALGIALRRVRRQEAADGRPFYVAFDNWIETIFHAFMVILHWIVAIVPLAVFGIVASVVGTQGFQPFVGLAVFVVAVLVALLLQAIYYMIRVRLGSWVPPGRLLRGSSDALTTAFATASSTATMPITYECLRDKVGLREESATMGALVGGNLNNDGTALYEAMAALFIAQALGIQFSLPQQLLVVVMAVVASVGAPGIPEAGLVTMLLVFAAVGLPPEYVPLLLTVDWFLDRCRTAINVMGDLTVSSLLDGKRQEERAPGVGTMQPQLAS
jgi:Na+/H+-dicarboxylate symporter